jgi:multidrug efflux pump
VPQNTQVTAGQIGGLPAAPGIGLQCHHHRAVSIADAEEFEKIVIKADHRGGTIYRKDVARVELGADTYAFSSR